MTSAGPVVVPLNSQLCDNLVIDAARQTDSNSCGPLDRSVVPTVAMQKNQSGSPRRKAKDEKVSPEEEERRRQRREKNKHAAARCR